MRDRFGRAAYSELQAQARGRFSGNAPIRTNTHALALGARIEMQPFPAGPVSQLWVPCRHERRRIGFECEEVAVARIDRWRRARRAHAAPDSRERRSRSTGAFSRGSPCRQGTLFDYPLYSIIHSIRLFTLLDFPPYSIIHPTLLPTILTLKLDYWAGIRGLNAKAPDGWKRAERGPLDRALVFALTGRLCNRPAMLALMKQLAMQAIDDRFELFIGQISACGDLSSDLLDEI